MGQVNSVVYAPDGSYIAAIYSDEIQDHLIIWDPETGREAQAIELIGEGVVRLICSSDSRSICCGDAGGYISLWNRLEGSFGLAHAISPSDETELSDIGIAFNSQYALAAMNGTVQIALLPNWSELNRLSGYDAPVAAAFLPDNKSIVMSSAGRGEVIDISSGLILTEAIIAPEPVIRIVVPGKGDRCYYWDAFSIFVWDLSKNHVQYFSEETHNREISHVPYIPGDVSADRKLLVSIYGKSIVRVFNTESHDIIQQFDTQSEQLTDVVFAPDGKHILVSSWDGIVRLWDWIRGIEIRRFSFIDR